jgi:hypothetical protein
LLPIINEQTDPLGLARRYENILKNIAGQPSATILIKQVTRSSAVQKITGALDGVVKEAEIEAALANCRGLVNQIDGGLSAEKLFLNISSAAELLFYLEFAASALKKAAPRPRKRG